ncbi:MAG: hypothetical protein KAT56_04320 [Sedimentisphaerales bacterium]|nr:hypothetical protein [Sedimentisphaerales bacterium]
MSGPCVLRLSLSARVIVLLIVLAILGCGGNSVERVYRSPYRPAFNIAVVPFLNQSGNENLDVMAVTDEFYTELQQVTGGLQVIPVNRVLAALSELGMRNVSNPDEVMMLAGQLGADAVIVGTVTRYDPYQPPRMGMALQLYHREKADKEKNVNSIDPGDISRRGKAFGMPGGVPLRPETMVVRIFDADRKDVIARIKKYTHHRQTDTTPSGWKKFLTSRNYLRFVCYEMIGELLAQEHKRLTPISIEGDSP